MSRCCHRNRRAAMVTGDEQRVDRHRATRGAATVSIRLAVGLGDPEREHFLLPALAESGDFVVVARCLAADQLLACLQRGRVDAALLAADLHRLTESALGDLERARLPPVLLPPQPD